MNNEKNTRKANYDIPLVFAGIGRESQKLRNGNFICEIMIGGKNLEFEEAKQILVWSERLSNSELLNSYL